MICGDQGPPNFCLHRAARMLRPAPQRIKVPIMKHADISTMCTMVVKATENNLSVCIKNEI